MYIFKLLNVRDKESMKFIYSIFRFILLQFYDSYSPSLFLKECFLQFAMTEITYFHWQYYLYLNCFLINMRNIWSKYMTSFSKYNSTILFYMKEKIYPSSIMSTRESRSVSEIIVEITILYVEKVCYFIFYLQIYNTREGSTFFGT